MSNYKFIEHVISQFTRELSRIQYSGNQTQNPQITCIENFMDYFKDPFRKFTLFIAACFIYYYFTNGIMCLFVGLLCPGYYAYILLNNDAQFCIEKIKKLIKYYIIYGHIEIVSMLMQFMHLKILAYIALQYMLYFNSQIFDDVYNKIIYYDNVLFCVAKSFTKTVIEKFYIEIDKYHDIHNTIKN